jgi:hypothetical protein
MKEADQSGHSSRRVETTEMMGTEDFRFPLFGNGPCHSGFQKTGKDRVHPDAMDSVSSGERPGETQQRCFGRRVGRLTWGRMDRRLAGNEDDVAGSLFDHPGQGSSGASGCSLVVDRQHFVPRTLIHACQQGVTRDSCRANQEIDRSRFEKPADRSGIQNLQLAVTRRGNFPLRTGERIDDRLSQAATASGDDQMIHVAERWPGSFAPGKPGDFQEPRKRLGITSE